MARIEANNHDDGQRDSTISVRNDVDQRDKSSESFSLGLKSKLFLAFAAMALLTVGASVVAWYAFIEIERSVTDITDGSIPALSASLKLAEKSAELAAIAPTLMTSRDQEERVRAQVSLETGTKELRALLKRLAESQTSEAVTVDLQQLYDGIVQELGKLNSAVGAGLSLKAQRELAVGQVTSSHRSLLEVIEPIVDDAVFDLVMSSEALSARSEQALSRLMEGNVQILNRLLEVNAKASLAATILTKITYLTDPVLIQPLREQFIAAADGINRALGELPDTQDTLTLQKALDTLLRIGQGDGNSFDQRIRDLQSDVDSTHSNVKQRERVSRALEVAHSNVLIVVAPLVDDASFDLVITGEEIAQEAGQSFIQLVEGGVSDLTTLLLLRAEANLASGLLTEAASVIDTSLLQPVKERFVAATSHMRRRVHKLPSTSNTGLLIERSETLLQIGEGSNSIFELRARELQQAKMAEKALHASQGFIQGLRMKVDSLVNVVQSESENAASAAAYSTQRGKQLLLVIVSLSVLGAGSIILFYVAPRIVAPLESMTNAMVHVAKGDTAIEIPGQERTDEVGRMAQALNVFRDTTREVQETNLREIREARQRLTDAIESISEGFSLYDSDDCLVVCNNRYREMLYPGLEQIVTPGMPFKTIIRSAAERGLIRAAEGRVDEWVAERMARHQDPGDAHIQQRGDDRWIQVNERKTESGYTVAIYTDISSLKQAEEEARVASHRAEKALQDLTQAQEILVHAEKMASLGELTAGIAHEIKNPLNFVNNFAEVSRELLDEVKEALQPSIASMGQDEKEDVEDAIDLLSSNLNKIKEHGVRADRIVKSMLDHSREGPSTIATVDLNALVNDVVNLAQHGTQAEDQGFKAHLECELDSDVGELALFPQEITRVLMNLVGNGFYALRERFNKGNADYVPTLRVSTRDKGDNVEIRIRDNGTGIPAELIDKIFDPFFTTKPTGEGTGLGLSLSYDIVVKQHQGRFEVDSLTGEFTEFIVTLPRGLSDVEQETA